MTSDERFAALERRARTLEAQVKSLAILARGDRAEIQKAKNTALTAVRLAARKQGEHKL